MNNPMQILEKLHVVKLEVIPPELKEVLGADYDNEAAGLVRAEAIVGQTPGAEVIPTPNYDGQQTPISNVGDVNGFQDYMMAERGAVAWQEQPWDKRNAA